MSLDWANERYVRVYTRDTAEQLCWPWEARAIWWLLIRKADRSGMLPVPTKLGMRGVAALISMPVEVVEVGLAALLEDGCVRAVPEGFLIPNYIEAQETPASDAKRQRDLRERRRATATIENDEVESHAPSPVVADRHAPSRAVTPSLSDPILTDPSLAVPIQGDSEGSPSASPPPGQPAPVLSLVPPEPPRKGKTSARQLPAGWKPNGKHVAIARERGLDLELEAEKMRDWAAAGAETAVDWDARFCGWLRRATPARAAPIGRHHGGGGGPLTGLDAFLAQQAEEKNSR